jgi:hypothetical protein
VKLVVFVGPSLPLAQARLIVDADYRPPAARGDVYRAALARPWGIGIIDGYFERVPAVWHKEILWALSRGTHVFGASSMGALRAAELASFGMVGVGEIFEAFRAGALTDDDEVTIAHADADAGYRAASTALVDMRATLAFAREQGVLSEPHAGALLALAQRTHYVDRNYPRLIADARTQQLPTRVLDQLERWLPEHEVAQKHKDAVRLLEHMRDHSLRDPAPKKVAFSFEHTDAFERFVQVEHTPQPEAADSSALVDELRLRAGQYAQLAERSWARLLALELADRLHIDSDEATYRAAVTALRRARGLHDAAQTWAWLDAQRLDRDGLETLVREQTRAQVVRQLFAGELERALLAELRSTDAFPALAQRAQHKRDLLREHGLDDPDLESCGLDERELIDWYMAEIGATNTHDQVMALSAQLDCKDGHAFLRLIMREYLYRKLASAAGAHAAPVQGK